MPTTPLQTTDSRMLQLIDILKTSGTIRFTQEFCDTLGIKKQNIPGIKKGIWSFTAKQIATVCEVYGVNPSWIFGYSEQVFRSAKKPAILAGQRAN